MYKPINIQNYLGRCDTWNYYEIALFNNILFTFTLEDAVLLGHRLVLSLRKKQKIKSISDEDVLILINLISYCLEENAEVAAHKLLNEVSTLSISEFSAYSRIMILWINTIFKIKYNQAPENDLHHTFHVLSVLEMDETLIMLKNWSKKLLN
nr:hypothetical protein [Enterococcus sp. DIV2402]